MNEVRRALYSRLAADGTLTGLLASPTSIFHQVAPQDARMPAVIFHKQAGRPIWQFDSAHIQTDLWTVKGVDLGSSASTAENIAARIDELLTDAPLAVTGRALLAVYRESDIDYSEQDGADTYRHVGGVYRLATQPT